MDFNSLLSHVAERYGPPHSFSNSRPSRRDWETDAQGGVIRHQIHDVWNEDYYWLPWDESMEPAKKEEQEPRVYVSLDLSISRPFVRLLKVIPL